MNYLKNIQDRVMNITIELTDEFIRDTLIEHKVITKKRVMACGIWCNTKTGIDSHIHYPYKYKCNDLVCRVCRKRRRNFIRTRHYIQNEILTAKGGETILLTLTIPHSAKDNLNDLYKRFRTSLTQMKKGWIWRKMKRETGMEYHYDTIEITKNDNGFHIHNHITLGCFGNKLSLQEIKDYLFRTWKHYTSKNGVRRISKKGLDVSQTPLGGHSGETDTKDNGYLEKLEYLSCKYKTDRKYKHPTLTEEQIDRDIRTINSSMRGAKRGKTYNKHTGK